MNGKDLRSRLDAALDERRDPLDDAELVAALERDDDALEEFAAWREMERALAALPRPVAERRRPWLALALAASAMLGVGLWLVFRAHHGSEPSARSTPIANATPSARSTPSFEILSFRAAIEHRSANGTQRWEQVGLGSRANLVHKNERPPAQDLVYAVFTSTVEHP